MSLKSIIGFALNPPKPQSKVLTGTVPISPAGGGSILSLGKAIVSNPLGAVKKIVQGTVIAGVIGGGGLALIPKLYNFTKKGTQTLLTGGNPLSSPPAVDTGTTLATGSGIAGLIAGLVIPPLLGGGGPVQSVKPPKIIPGPSSNSPPVVIPNTPPAPGSGGLPPLQKNPLPGLEPGDAKQSTNPLTPGGIPPTLGKSSSPRKKHKKKAQEPRGQTISQRVDLRIGINNLNRKYINKIAVAN